MKILENLAFRCYQQAGRDQDVWKSTLYIQNANPKLGQTTVGHILWADALIPRETYRKSEISSVPVVDPDLAQLRLLNSTSFHDPCVVHHQVPR